MKVLSGLFLFLSIICFFPARSQSVSEIDSLKTALKNEKGNQSKVEHLFLLNDKLVAIHDFKQARQYLDSALLLSKKLNYEHGIAMYYNGLGTLLNIEGNYPEALADYSVSLNMGMKIGDSLLVARVSLNIGKLYNKTGKFDEAMNYLNQALRISIRMGDKEIQKAAYDKLSVAYTFHGNYPEAIRCIEKAIKLAEEAGNTSEAKKSSLNLGIIYKYQGNFVKALEVFL